jgi:hypothetical protein
MVMLYLFFCCCGNFQLSNRAEKASNVQLAAVIGAIQLSQRNIDLNVLHFIPPHLLSNQPFHSHVSHLLAPHTSESSAQHPAEVCNIVSCVWQWCRYLPEGPLSLIISQKGYDLHFSDRQVEILSLRELRFVEYQSNFFSLFIHFLGKSSNFYRRGMSRVSDLRIQIF